jgi:chromosome segregation ATPase
MSIADKSRDISELKREVNHYIIRLKKSEVAESESIVIVANLRDELLEMERSNDRFTRRLVELNRLVESKNKSKDVIDELDTMKNELAEANKRTKLLLSELSVKAENEKLLNHSMEIVKSDKSKMVKRVLAMKEEVKILKLALENEKVDFNESIKTGIDEIQLRFDKNIQQLIQGVWKLLVTLELVHDSGDIPNRVTDLVLVLKSALTASTTELSRCRNAYRAALTDNEELVGKASLLEEKLRRLNSRISSFESNRISEDLMMSKLRESIESAETRLNRARPPAVNPR